MAGGFDLSGGGRVISIYAEKLQSRGHEVLVITRPRKKPTLLMQVKSLIKDGRLIEKINCAPSHFDHLKLNCKQLESFRPVVDSDIPDGDVVIATWWETADWVNCLSPSKGSKVFFIQHYEAFDYIPKSKVNDAWRMPLHKITISRWLADMALDDFGDKNASLVFNSVDINQFHAPTRKKQATPTIGLLYNTLYWKGCDISLRAFSLVAEQIKNVKLIAFGHCEISPDTPLPPGSEYYISPDQENIKEIYARCDVWLCGSRSEGFHLPPLEAMACRCPVVSTAVGGPMDTIEDGFNGYVVAVEDYESLADRLITILRLSEIDWKIMSDNALETATSYTWDDATDIFESTLTDLKDQTIN